MKDFSISDAMQFGWDKFKENAKFLILALLVQVVVSLLLGLFPNPGENILGAIGFIINIIISILMSIGFTKIGLKIHDGETVSLGELFRYSDKLLNYFVVGIIVGISVAIGFIFLIIPGILILLYWLFTDTLVADRNYNPFQAMKLSAEITKGARFKLFLFGLAAIGINILGLIALGIGLFVTIPMTMLAFVWVYRTLIAQTNFNDELEPVDS